MRLVAVLCFVVSMVSAPGEAYSGEDIVINLPAIPSGFPKKFPAYKKCKVNGKRQACYGKKGVKQLLLLWDRYIFLREIPAVVLKQAGVIRVQRKLILKLKVVGEHLRKANTAHKKANKSLRSKIKRDERRRSALILRNTLIGVGVAVAAVAGGVAIGYVIGASQK